MSVGNKLSFRNRSRNDGCMLTWLQLSAGLVALVAGGELLVRGASRLAALVGLSPLVIGLTVVAFGTSAPELAVSVASALSGRADIAVGNVVGSNIFNVLFILGASALIVPLAVNSTLIRSDVPLMVAASLLAAALSLDGSVGRIEGGFLFTGLVAYTVRCIVAGRRESSSGQSRQESDTGSDELMPSDVTRGRLRNVLLITAGLVLLVLGSEWLVDAASTLARQMGVSELVIGLTIVAAGTSLPEVATSIIAAIKGERDIAVGNVVGSNLFNLLGVLGLAATISPGGIAVSEQALALDIPVMIASAVACFLVCRSAREISRFEGAFLIAAYVVYSGFLIARTASGAA